MAIMYVFELRSNGSTGVSRPEATDVISYKHVGHVPGTYVVASVSPSHVFFCAIFFWISSPDAVTRRLPRLLCKNRNGSMSLPAFSNLMVVVIDGPENAASKKIECGWMKIMYLMQGYVMLNRCCAMLCERKFCVYHVLLESFVKCFFEPEHSECHNRVGDQVREIC